MRYRLSFHREFKPDKNVRTNYSEHSPISVVRLCRGIFDYNGLVLMAPAHK